MDPLADKLLVSAALVSLVEYHVLMGWIAIVIIAREFAVTGLRSIAAAEGVILAASKWGKAKTFIQIIAILMALINLNLRNFKILHNSVNFQLMNNFKTTSDIAMYIAVIVTIISGVDYFMKNKDIIKLDK
jgi:CDP-diacylglycerol--glycerol-3-phosphate 3-phosphatidyltransferase